MRITTSLLILLAICPSADAFSLAATTTQTPASPCFGLQKSTSSREITIRNLQQARNAMPSVHLGLRMQSVRILYEDANLVAFDKPFDAVEKDVIQTLSSKGVQQVIFPEFPDEMELAASGVVFAAKNANSAKRLREKLDYGYVTKSYLALLQGTLEERVLIKRQGENSQTIIDPLGWGSYLGQSCTYVRLVPRRGRRHLLKVHSDYAGHPILGDETFCDPQLTAQVERIMLHSQSVTIRDDSPWRSYTDRYGHSHEKEIRIEAINAVVHYVDDLELSATQARSRYCDW